ncbi:MAG: DUF4186 domain-containing protein [Burkholderiales bacterium]|nr:DUF4186 domain-containing protein [Burkholderiales bacterium]
MKTDEKVDPAENSPSTSENFEFPEPFDHLFERLSHSAFRSKFKLDEKDRKYAQRKGLEELHRHTVELLTQRLAPAYPVKDGKQTPWKGHPVFTAQHAVGCCCRSCLYKWHHISKGRPLTPEEVEILASYVLEWIRRDLEKAPKTSKPQKGTTLDLFSD